MSGTTRKLIFGETRLDIDSRLTLAQAKELAQNVVSGIADAEGHQDADGNYVFTKRAGRKG